ncbi:MAG: hypothetical protein J7619_08625 [Dyadobacter sp.]|uniref:hypothetical protein n=1 Tax=Dyadobacter sp. TaxID=1914288 RepID=UPI001B242152|nr:hypothetical protein [Dyadobacter sp.]MBO9612743.1 hypothetical protein [Dyadobacter sp.]
MRAELRNRLDAYMSQIRAADTSEIPEIKSTFFGWYNSVSDEDRAAMQPFWDEMKEEMWGVINEIKELMKELITLKEEELAEARKRLETECS